MLLIQALLTSEESSRAVIKHGGSFSFHSTMRILLGLANLEDDGDIEERMTNLIYKDTVFSPFEELGIKRNAKERICKLAEVKTHVINILRALFRHCQLGECVKPYIADGVISAIKSYNGKTWAVSIYIYFFLLPINHRTFFLSSLFMKWKLFRFNV